ncbi:hypothetical protein JCM3765_003648 [Sporobolomyces pararoseus]
MDRNSENPFVSGEGRTYSNVAGNGIPQAPRLTFAVPSALVPPVQQIPMSSHDQQEANLRWMRDHSSGAQRTSTPLPVQPSLLPPSSYPLSPRSFNNAPYPFPPPGNVSLDPRFLPPQSTAPSYSSPLLERPEELNRQNDMVLDGKLSLPTQVSHQQLLTRPHSNFVPQSPLPSLPLPPQPVRNVGTRSLPPRPVKPQYYPSQVSSLNSQQLSSQPQLDFSSIPPPLPVPPQLQHPTRSYTQPLSSAQHNSEDEEDEGYVSDEPSDKEGFQHQTSQASRLTPLPHSRPIEPVSPPVSPPVDSVSAFQPQPRSLAVDSPASLSQQPFQQDYSRPHPISTPFEDRQQSLLPASSYEYPSDRSKTPHSIPVPSQQNQAPIPDPTSFTPLDTDSSSHKLYPSSSFQDQTRAGAGAEAQVENQEPKTSSFSDEEMDRIHQAPDQQEGFSAEGTRRTDQDTQESPLEGEEPEMGMQGGGDRWEAGPESTLPQRTVPRHQQLQEDFSMAHFESSRRMKRSSEEEEDRERNEGNAFRPARRSEASLQEKPQTIGPHEEEEEPQFVEGSPRPPKRDNFRASRARPPAASASFETPSPVESSPLDSMPEQRSDYPHDDEQYDDSSISADSQRSLSPSPEPHSAFSQQRQSFKPSGYPSPTFGDTSLPSPSSIQTESDLSSDYDKKTKPPPQPSTPYNSLPVDFDQQSSGWDIPGGEHEESLLPGSAEKDEGYMTDDSNESVSSEGNGNSKLGRSEQAVDLKTHEARSGGESGRGGENEHSFGDEGFDDTLNDNEQPRSRRNPTFATYAEQSHLRERREELEDEGRGGTRWSPQPIESFDPHPSFSDYKDGKEAQAANPFDTSPSGSFNPSTRSSGFDAQDYPGPIRRDAEWSTTPPSSRFAAGNENERNFDQTPQSVNRAYDSISEESGYPPASFDGPRTSQLPAQDSNYPPDGTSSYNTGDDFERSESPPSYNSPPHSVEPNLSYDRNRPAAPHQSEARSNSAESTAKFEEDGDEYGTDSDSDYDDETGFDVGGDNIPADDSHQPVSRASHQSYLSGQEGDEEEAEQTPSESESSSNKNSLSDSEDEERLSKPTERRFHSSGEPNRREGEVNAANRGSPSFTLPAQSDEIYRSPSDDHTGSELSEYDEESTKSPPSTVIESLPAAFNQTSSKEFKKGLDSDTEEEDPGYATDESRESEESGDDQAHSSMAPSTTQKKLSEDLRGKGGDPSQNTFEDEGFDENFRRNPAANSGNDGTHTDSEDEDQSGQIARSRKFDQEEPDPSFSALHERSPSTPPSEASSIDLDSEADDTHPLPAPRQPNETGNVSASSVDFDRTVDPKTYAEGSNDYHTDSEASDLDAKIDDDDEFAKTTSNRSQGSLDKDPASFEPEIPNDDDYSFAQPNQANPNLSPAPRSSSDAEDLSDRDVQAGNNFDNGFTGQYSTERNDEDSGVTESGFGEAKGGENDRAMDYEGAQTDSSSSDFDDRGRDGSPATPQEAENPGDSFDSEQRDRLSNDSSAQSEDPASFSDQEREADRRQEFDNDSSNPSFGSGRGTDNFDSNDSYGGAEADPADRDGYDTGQGFDNLEGRGNESNYDGGAQTNFGGGNDYTENDNDGASNDRGDFSNYGNNIDGDQTGTGALGGEDFQSSQPSEQGSSYGGEYQSSPGELDDGYGQQRDYDGDQAQPGGSSYEPSDGTYDQNGLSDGEMDHQPEELAENDKYEFGYYGQSEDPYNRQSALEEARMTPQTPALRRFEDSKDVLHRIQHDPRWKTSEREQKAVVEILHSVHDLRRIEEEENRILTPIPSADDLDIDSHTYHLCLTILQDQIAQTLEEAHSSYQLNDSKANRLALRVAQSLNDAAIRQGRDLYLASVDAHEESLNDPSASSEEVEHSAVDRHFNATQELYRASQDVARAKAHLQTLEEKSLAHEAWEWDSRSDRTRQTELDKSLVEEARIRLRGAERRQRDRQRDLDEAAVYLKNASGVFDSHGPGLSLTGLDLDLRRHLFAVQQRHSAQLIVEEKQALLWKAYKSRNEEEIYEAHRSLKEAEADLERAKEEEQLTKDGLTHQARVDSAQLSEDLAKRELQRNLEKFADITFKHLQGGATREDLQDAQEAIDRARSTYATAVEDHRRAKDRSMVEDPESDHSVEERKWSEAAQRLLSHHEARVKALQLELEQDTSNLSASEELENHLRQKHLAASVLLQSHDLLLADAQRRLLLDPEDIYAQSDVKNATQSHGEAVEAERVSRKGADRQDQLDVARVLHDHLARRLEEKRNELENLELNLASEREVAAAHSALDHLETRHSESHLRLEHLEDKVALHHIDPSKSEEENRTRHHEAAYRLRNHFRRLLLSHQIDLSSAEDRYSQARLAMLEKRNSDFSKYVDDLDHDADHRQRLAVARANLETSRSSLELARESLRQAEERHLDAPSVGSEGSLNKAQTNLEAARHVHHLTKEELLERKLSRKLSGISRKHKVSTWS